MSAMCFAITESKFHLFADDKQAYVSGHVSDANAI